MVGRTRLRVPAVVLVGLALAVSILLCVIVGAADIAPSEVFRSVLHHLGLGPALDAQPLTPLRDAIVWDLRIPRVLTAGAVGAGLAICGVVMQAVTRNPLADPYLLGLSSGASLGAVAVLLLGVPLLLPIAAFGGAGLALAAALALAAWGGSAASPGRTVLAGVAVSQACAALVSLVVFWSASADSYREILSWLLGSVAGATWTSVWLTVGAVATLGLGLALSGNLLDGFGFGDEAAAALGIRVERTRLLLLVGTAMLTGALVSQSGAIGFIGLVVPHAVRLVAGQSHRLVLPLSGAAGALVLMWADTIARSAFAPRELPVGVVTAVLGAPIFAILLRRTRSAA
nr:putative F420-0 ABC transporter permease subunit [Rarobacter faecitabidus]